MLTHIVCWKYKTGISEETCEEHRARLKDLPNHIPQILSFSVGADVLHLERSFDTGLVAIFSGGEELDAYTVHPEHQKVAAMGKEVAEKVVSVDFYNE